MRIGGVKGSFSDTKTGPSYPKLSKLPKWKRKAAQVRSYEKLIRKLGAYCFKKSLYVDSKFSPAIDLPQVFDKDRD